MSTSSSFRLVFTGNFDETFVKIEKKVYKRDERGWQQFSQLLADIFVLLEQNPFFEVSSEPRVNGYAEGFPDKTDAIGGWSLRKIYFPMPNRKGAVGQGRLMYLTHKQNKEVHLLWVYTHADFEKRPEAKELRKAIEGAIQASQKRSNDSI